MGTFSKTPHKLSRDGFSQLDRENQALSPSSIKIDGRETKDFLQFLYQYARQINYYEQNSQSRSGDWIPFFRNSIPFQYAVIASYDLDVLDDRFEKVEQAIRSRKSYESLNLLFDLLFDMSDQLIKWLDDLQMDNSGLRSIIQNLIETNLRAQFIKLVQLANSAGKWGYKRSKDSKRLQHFWGISVMDLYGVDQSILSLKGSIKHKVLKSLSILEELYRTFWKAFQNIISTANDGNQLEKSLTNEDLGVHQPHLGLLFTFLELFKIAQGGLNELSDSHLNFFYKKTLQLKNQTILPDHAHLTFELAKKVEEDILLEKGTRFNAGKDDNGEDIFFELDEEIIVTKTKVADLRTLYLDRILEGSYQQDIETVEGLHMAPAANSADGLGEGFAKETDPRWPTVGSKPSKWTDPDNAQIVDHPFARIGFMLASKVLFLREGNRSVTINLTLKDALAPLPPDTDLLTVLPNIFEISLTTEEGWLKLSDHDPTLAVTPAVNGNTVSFSFILPNDFPPVIATAPDLLETDYGKALPMVKFEFNHENERAANYYAELRQKMICNITIDVAVCDVRQLIIQSDFALLDINKPFNPFGPIPKNNSSNFYIGSEEIFCKRWENVVINPVWKDNPSDLHEYYANYESQPNDNNAFKADLAFLANKNFKPHGSTTLFSPGGSGTNIPGCTNESVFWTIDRIGDDEICDDLSDILNGYLAETPCGFIRLKLGAQDFLHDEYANELIRNVQNIAQVPVLKDKIETLKSTTETLKDQADDTHDELHDMSCDSNALQNFDPTNDAMHTTQNLAQTAKSAASEIFDDIEKITNSDGEIPLINAPYTPLIESLSVNYNAQADTDTEDEISFTHLHPFNGTYEHQDIKFEENEVAICKTTVLPCFIDEGALYLGLENYKPGSNLNLHFQMEPASADPDMDKAVVCWEYLRNNDWNPLAIDTNVLSDTTNGLIQSGIIKFTIPGSISNKETTIMPSNLYWLKARVLLRTTAISETFDIQAQSAQVTFIPGEENDLGRLSSPLDAGLIAKLDSPLAAIKGIQQNYTGFGGRSEETSDLFYHRVSEHLRHKGRAISIYDYERIILQQFEEIYKVKCISHTLGRRGEAYDYELAPGFVTVVVIPDLNKVNAVNPLEPKVPAATLSKVKDLLRSKISPFVKLEVLNPIFETIKVTADVKFKAGKSNTFYANKLSEDVTSFLAPWTFSDNRQDISFGGKVFYSTILKFIEDQDYVDFLVNFKMQDKGENFAEVIQASNSRVVLTSGVHEFHPIESIEELSTASTTGNVGIGHSKIPKL